MRYFSEDRIEYSSDAADDDIEHSLWVQSLWFKFFTNTASLTSPNDPIR